MIRALLGDVEAAGAGFVDAHEHLVAHATPTLVARDLDLLLDEPGRVAEDLAAFRAAGGGTVVEMTTVDYGRDLDALAELSRRTSVHVVAATGFNKGTYCRRYCAGSSPAALSATQVVDVLERRCGVVKFGTSLDRIEPWEQTALEAAALTHHATGVPVLTHTETGTMALDQLDRLAALGVAPEDVVLGHLDHLSDLDVHLRVADRGARLSYDQVPKPKYATATRAIAAIGALARAGLHGQVVVGGDLARRSYFRGWGGSPGLAHLVTTFAADLTAALDADGQDGARITQDVLHTNPIAALAMRGGAREHRRKALR